MSRPTSAAGDKGHALPANPATPRKKWTPGRGKVARLLRLVCWVVGHNWCDCPVCQVDNYFTLLCRRCRYMEDVKRSPYEPFAVNPALIETVRRGSTLIPFTDESTLGDIAAMLKKNPPKETHG